MVIIMTIIDNVYTINCKLSCSGNKCNTHNVYIDFIKFKC